MAKRRKEEEKPLSSSQEFDLDEFRSKASSSFEKYKNLIYGSIFFVILLVGGLYYYFAMYKAPREAEANELIFKAQAYFERDSFALALNGREDVPGQLGGFMGFFDIIDEYGGTDAANVAHYYAGISLLNIGKYPDAITFLSNYSAGDYNTQAMAYGLIGDAYSEQDEFEQALSYYEKAANYVDNKAISPYWLRKAGLLSELKIQNAEKAKGFYQKIKTDYPLSAEKMSIDKDLIRITKEY